jgi:hypothetical protein
MRALAIADRLEDTEYQLRALWGLWSHRMSSGEYRAALAFAERFRAIAIKQPDPAARLIADRMVGSMRLYMGDQTGARRHIERMLSRYVDPLHRSHMIRFVWDQRVAGEIILAVILWLQGFPDQAMGTVRRTIERARASDHAISLCYTLARAACPVALWVGDLAAAEYYVSMLLDHSAKLAMAVWQAEGRCFKGILLIKRGRDDTGLRLLRTALDEVRNTGPILRDSAFLCALAEGLAGTGKSPMGSRRSTRRLSDRRAAESVGASPSCCASRASLSCRRTDPMRPQWPRITSGSRSTGHAGKAPCPGSSAPP